MLKKQMEAVAALIKDDDLKKYAGEFFWNFIQAVINQDINSGVTSMRNAKDLIFHLPTALFWDKMQRFLLGTYKNFEEQVKMAGRFNNENDRYLEFVKKQIYLINEIDDDEKIDYFISLTRCLLLMDMELALYFKLAKYLVLCTSYELKFIGNSSLDSCFENTAMISILYQYGLLDQIDDEDSPITLYAFSGFGKALKSCCLNFDEEAGRPSVLKYKELEPLNIPEPAKWIDIDKIIPNS